MWTKMDVYIQLNSMSSHIAYMNQGRLSSYVVLCEDEPVEYDIYIGMIGQKIPGMNAYIVKYKKKKEALLKRKDIPKPLQSHCTEGARILFQILKPGLNKKMPLVTMNIQYRSRFLIWIPYESGIFISKKIPKEIRVQIHKKLQEQKKEGKGCLVVRTEAKQVSDEVLMAEYLLLKQKWQVHQKRLTAKEAPQRLTNTWERLENHLLLQNRIPKKIVVNTAKYKKNLANLFPDADLSTYLGKTPLFIYNHIAEQLEQALKNTVQAESNGVRLIFHETEAAVFIDINSGSSFMENTGEMAAFENNKESIPLLTEQIRLRNLSGVIFIDFINMKKKEHQDEILHRMRKAFQKEGKQTEIYGFTALGFLEMRRTRVQRRLSEIFLESCSTCNGQGRIFKADKSHLESEDHSKSMHNKT